MKNIKLTILTLFISASLTSQVHNLGIKGGINISNIRAEKFFDDTNNKLGFIGGIRYELHLGKYLLGVDFVYSQYGFYDRIRWGYPDQIGQDADTKFDYDYLSTQLKFGYIFGRKFNFIPKIGLQPSILINAKTTIPISNSNGEIIDEEIRDVKEIVAPFDLAVFLELEFGYNLTKRINIFTSLAGKYSMTTFSDTEYFSCCELKHHALEISLGLKYKILTGHNSKS